MNYVRCPVNSVYFLPLWAPGTFMTDTKKRIIISKMNQIGDVTFSLPMASLIKEAFPDANILFMGRSYTKALIENHPHVDGFVDGEAIDLLSEKEAIRALKALSADIIVHVYSTKTMIKRCKKAKIAKRVGNQRRISHWFYCNQLVWVKRKNSGLHESQLDLVFLKGLGLKSSYSIDEIIKRLPSIKPALTDKAKSFLSTEKFNLILHSKTRGEHIEWPLTSFSRLINKLDKTKVNIIATGSEEERKKFAPFLLRPFRQVIDATNLPLADLLSLIAHADGLIAASTGPVHLAANAGIRTLGLYAPIKPFDASRWGPIGAKTTVLAKDKDCSFCRDGRSCQCIMEISPDEVYREVMMWLKDYQKEKTVDAQIQEEFV